MPGRQEEQGPVAAQRESAGSLAGRDNRQSVALSQVQEELGAQGGQEADVFREEERKVGN